MTTPQLLAEQQQQPGAVEQILAKLLQKQAAAAAAQPLHPPPQMAPLLATTGSIAQPAPRIGVRTAADADTLAPAGQCHCASLRAQLAAAAQQLEYANAEHARTAALLQRHREREAALEARALKLESEAAAAAAGRRRAEQAAAEVNARGVAQGKASASRVADAEEAAEFYRAQLERKSEEAAQLERSAKVSPPTSGLPRSAAQAAL